MKSKRILVACEHSGVVRGALNSIHGITAISCDLLPPEDGMVDYHYQGDVMEILYDGWDGMIAHPPCTYLCNSGVSWLYNKDDSINVERWAKMVDGTEFFRALLEAPIKYKAIENPIPHKYAVELIGRKYDQIIHPDQFGHLETKATCLWLENLPKLQPTNDVREERKKLPKSQQQRLHYLPPSANRGLERSRTFSGIGMAMATQWANYILQQES